MRKYLLAFTSVILVTVVLCGCSGAKAGDYDSKSEVSVIFADKETLNGYRMYDYDKSDLADKIVNTTGTYYANTNSRVFHLKDCSHAGKIKSENLYITSERAELISKGYRPCKSCNP